MPLRSRRLPHDVGVGYLLDGGGLPLPVRPENLRLPGALLIVELEGFALLHEARKVFVLCPEVVGRTQRKTDIQRLKNYGDLELLPLTPATTASSPEEARDLVLQLAEHPADSGAS